MHLLRRVRRGLTLALSGAMGGTLVLTEAGATAAETTSATFVELKGARVTPSGQSGLQVIKLADGTSLPVSEDKVLVRQDMIFLRMEVAEGVGIPTEARGTLLEIIEANHSHSSSTHGHFGTVASTLGAVTGTMVVASAMDDLSDDLVRFSTTALETIDDASVTETLDGEENEALKEETDPGTQTNDAPVFDAAPTGGEANESAENGSAVGAIVQASDPEGEVVTYTITAQQIEGAFSVEPSTGVIRVADSEKINFEAHETLDLTIAATDASGAQAEQSVTITILDDPSDTLMTTATYTVTHPEFSSGAFVLSDSMEDTIYFGHAGVMNNLEDDTNSLLVEMFLRPSNYLLHDAIPSIIPGFELSDSSFTALAEVNAAELANDFLTLSSYVENANGDNWLGYSLDGTTFTELFALASPTQTKNVDQGLLGTAEATYTLTDSTITKLGDGGFTQTEAVFAVGPGDIWHLADLNGDDHAELILKKAGVGAADVYQNLGSSFDTTPMAETMLTGVNIDDLAGGRALDISIRDHFSDGNLTFMVLGETDAFLYELT
mgnify:FL=1